MVKSSQIGKVPQVEYTGSEDDVCAEGLARAKGTKLQEKGDPIITMLVIVDEHPENAVRRFSVPYLSDRVFCRIGPENEEVGNRRAEKK